MYKLVFKDDTFSRTWYKMPKCYLNSNIKDSYDHKTPINIINNIIIKRPKNIKRIYVPTKEPVYINELYLQEWISLTDDIKSLIWIYIAYNRVYYNVKELTKGIVDNILYVFDSKLIIKMIHECVHIDLVLYCIKHILKSKSGLTTGSLTHILEAVLEYTDRQKDILNVFNKIMISLSITHAEDLSIVLESLLTSVLVKHLNEYIVIIVINALKTVCKKIDKSMAESFNGFIKHVSIEYIYTIGNHPLCTRIQKSPRRSYGLETNDYYINDTYGPYYPNIFKTFQSPSRVSEPLAGPGTGQDPLRGPLAGSEIFKREYRVKASETIITEVIISKMSCILLKLFDKSINASEALFYWIIIAHVYHVYSLRMNIPNHNVCKNRFTYLITVADLDRPINGNLSCNDIILHGSTVGLWKYIQAPQGMLGPLRAPERGPDPQGAPERYRTIACALDIQDYEYKLESLITEKTHEFINWIRDK
jgi:hypothetical protein